MMVNTVISVALPKIKAGESCCYFITETWKLYLGFPFDKVTHFLLSLNLSKCQFYLLSTLYTSKKNQHITMSQNAAGK